METDDRSPLLPKRSNHEWHPNYDLSSSHGSVNGYGCAIGPEEDAEVKDCQQQQQQHIYKRRWYILLLFSFLGFAQNMVWNTWSPLSQSVQVAFGWTNTVVALQANWGCITYIISAAFFSWLMDVKGLRTSCMITATLVTFGSALRCITTEPQPATFLIHAGQILNGFAGPVLMAGPPVLSALWFPAYQRATATSLIVFCQTLGVAGSFVIGPLLVPNVNVTVNASTEISGMFNSTENAVDATRFNIMKLMYIECVSCCTVFLAILVYFPDRPPLPPSVSAYSYRIDFKAGMHQLLRHLSFWKVSVSYALALGISGIWASLVSFYAISLISEGEAGWLGFYGAVACGFAGCLFSRFTDIYARRQKCILIFLYSFSLCCCVIFSLECMKKIPFHRGILYSTYIGATAGLQGCAPLFFELICETAFPIAEGLTNGIQTWLNNLVGLIFLLVFFIPSVGNSKDMQWMNWTNVCATATCIPILITYTETYNRLDLDTVTVTDEQMSEPTDNSHVANGSASVNGILPQIA